MAIHLAVVETDIADEEIRCHLDEFFAGRISYVRLCNELNMETSEVDACIVEVVYGGIKKNNEGVLRH